MGDDKKPLPSPILSPSSSSAPPPPPITTSSAAADDEDDAAAAAAESVPAAAAAAAAAAASASAARPIGLAILALVIYVVVGVIGFGIPSSALERKSATNRLVDAFYFSVSTLLTVGCGDIRPGTPLAMVLSVLFALLGCALLKTLLAVTVPAAGKALAALRRRRRRHRALIAAAAILLPVAVGALVFHFVGKQGWVESLYMSVISVTTVGDDKEVFKRSWGRVIASVWLFFGTLMVTHASSFLGEELLDWWTPRTDFVTRPEFAIIVLLEKGMLSASDDLGPIYAKFKALDRRNCGRVRLSSLTQNQHRIFSENNNLQGAGT